MIEYIDASVFMGMHAKDEQTRVACKNYMIDHLANAKSVTICLEQVGKCDAIVWRYDRTTQDAYYPFMDNLHTVMDIRRIGYERPDLEKALTLGELPTTDALAVAMAMNNNGVLYTAKSEISSQSKFPVKHLPTSTKELSFPGNLESLYQQSLALRC